MSCAGGARGLVPGDPHPAAGEPHGRQRRGGHHLPQGGETQLLMMKDSGLNVLLFYSGRTEAERGVATWHPRHLRAAAARAAREHA